MPIINKLNFCYLVDPSLVPETFDCFATRQYLYIWKGVAERCISVLFLGLSTSFIHYNCPDFSPSLWMGIKKLANHSGKR